MTKEIKKYYYSIDCPTLWELIYEDEFFYYMKPLSRISVCLDRINKDLYFWKWWIFETKEDLIKYSNEFNNNEIKKLEEKLEQLKKYKEQRISLISKIKELPQKILLRF